MPLRAFLLGKYRCIKGSLEYKNERKIERRSKRLRVSANANVRAISPAERERERSQKIFERTKALRNFRPPCTRVLISIRTLIFSIMSKIFKLPFDKQKKPHALPE